MNNCCGMLDSSDNEKFYGDAKKYWATVEPNVDGMLGGYAHISSTDIAGSTQFLRNFLEPRGKVGKLTALDCGSGIGRITKRLLLPIFKEVDMAELNQEFLDEAKSNYLGDDAKRIGNYFCTGLESFTPAPGHYDLIWVQWVTGQLKNDDFVEFFQRCRKGLKPDGLIVIKENVTRVEMEFDKQDSSYCRPRDSLVTLTERAGLKLIKEEKQKNFPKELYEVMIFALQ